jgi:hypothetical protein
VNVPKSAAVKPLGVLVLTVVVGWLVKTTVALPEPNAVDVMLGVHPAPKQPRVLKVTGSACATVWAAVKIASSATLMASGLSIVARFFMISFASVDPFT